MASLETLPVEVLEKFFTYCIPPLLYWNAAQQLTKEAVGRSAVPEATLVRTTLMLVCWGWQSVIKNMPMAWRTLHLKTEPYERDILAIEKDLSRAGACPLDIYIEMTTQNSSRLDFLRNHANEIHALIVNLSYKSSQREPQYPIPDLPDNSLPLFTFPKLQFFSMYNHTLDSGIHPMFRIHAPGLSALSLDLWMFNATALVSNESLSNLKVLSLMHHTSFREVSKFSFFDNLESIHWYIKGDDRTDFSSPATTPPSVILRRLKYMYLSVQISVDIHRILGNTQAISLEEFEFHVSSGQMITISDWIPVWDHAISELTRGFLSFIGNGLPKLHKLVINELNLTAEDFRAVMDNSPQLHKFTLRYCRLSNTFFFVLNQLLLGGHGLRELVIHSCVVTTLWLEDVLVTCRQRGTLLYIKILLQDLALIKGRDDITNLQRLQKKYPNTPSNPVRLAVDFDEDSSELLWESSEKHRSRRRQEL